MNIKDEFRINFFRSRFASKDASDFWTNHFGVCSEIYFEDFIEAFKNYLIQTKNIYIREEEELWIKYEIFGESCLESDSLNIFQVRSEVFSDFYSMVWEKRLGAGNLSDIKQLYRYPKRSIFESCKRIKISCGSHTYGPPGYTLSGCALI